MKEKERQKRKNERMTEKRKKKGKEREENTEKPNTLFMHIRYKLNCFQYLSKKQQELYYMYNFK